MCRLRLMPIPLYDLKLVMGIGLVVNGLSVCFECDVIESVLDLVNLFV